MIEALAQTTLEALLNTLWLGSLLTLGVGWLVRSNPSLNATSRYGILWLNLLALLVLPVVLLGRDVAPPEATLALPSSPPLGALPLTLPLADLPLPTPSLPWLVGLTGCWLLGVIFLLLRLGMGYLYIQRCKRQSLPLPEPDQARLAHWQARYRMTRPVRLVDSRDIPLPIAVGFIRPVILIPTELRSKLTPAEFDQVGLHELAHLYRWDDWTNLVQRVAEALLFFHPAVFWLGRELNLAREIACDDWVISVTGQPKPYAHCLTRILELTQPLPRPLIALGARSNTQQLTQRITMLLDAKRNRLPRFPRYILCSTALGLAALVWGSRFTPVIALPTRLLPELPPLSAPAPVEALAPIRTPRLKPVTPKVTPTPKAQAPKRRITVAEAPVIVVAQAAPTPLDRTLQLANETLDQQRKDVRERVRSFTFSSDERPAIPESELLPSLLKIARSDSDPQVRAEAFQAIARLNSDASVQALISLYDGAKDSGSKETILRALSRSNRKAAATKLLAIAQNDPDPKLRLQALRRLGRGGSSWSIEAPLPPDAPEAPIPPLGAINLPLDPTAYLVGDGTCIQDL